MEDRVREFYTRHGIHPALRTLEFIESLKKKSQRRIEENCYCLERPVPCQYCHKHQQAFLRFEELFDHMDLKDVLKKKYQESLDRYGTAGESQLRQTHIPGC